MRKNRRTKIARDLGAPAAGRRFVRSALADFPEARSAAELVVSELLTNAVIHETTQGGPLEVGIDFRNGDTARLSVDLAPDHAAALEERRGGAHGGFGLGIVRALSKRWGVERNPGSQVWCDIDLAPTPGRLWGSGSQFGTSATT